MGAGTVSDIIERVAPPTGGHEPSKEAWRTDGFAVEVEDVPGLSVLGFTPEEVRAPAARMAGVPLLPRLRIAAVPNAALQTWYDNYIGKGDSTDLRTVRCVYTDKKGNTLLVAVYEDCGILSLCPIWEQPGAVACELQATRLRLIGPGGK